MSIQHRCFTTVLALLLISLLHGCCETAPRTASVIGSRPLFDGNTLNGWQGLVFNGCIRDGHEFAELDFGVKAIGTTPRRPRHHGLAETGVALYFGGIVINDGDYLYTDADGVIVAAGPLHE